MPLVSSSPSRANVASTSGVGHEALTAPDAAFLTSLAKREIQHRRSAAVKSVAKFTIRRNAFVGLALVINARSTSVMRARVSVCAAVLPAVGTRAKARSDASERPLLVAGQLST